MMRWGFASSLLPGSSPSPNIFPREVIMIGVGKKGRATSVYICNKCGQEMKPEDFLKAKSCPKCGGRQWARRQSSLIEQPQNKQEGESVCK